MSRYHRFLLVIFLIVWVWAAIDPIYLTNWIMENILVVIAVPLLIYTGRYFKFSDLSYTLITLFLILHVIGSHYAYVEVPFGYTLQDIFNSDRNLYDRLVHFLFGLLLVYPLREIFVRLFHLHGVSGFIFPLDIILSISGLHEVVEWVAATSVSESAGTTYIGSQGDIWDAQKDIAMAGIGAIITLSLMALMHWKYSPRFGREVMKSFIFRKGPDHDGRMWTRMKNAWFIKRRNGK